MVLIIAEKPSLARNIIAGTGEKMDKKDHVVLMNIAYTYRELGDKDTARKYYSKVIKYCSPEIAAEAMMLMDKLDE